MQLLYSLDKVGAIIGAQCWTTTIGKSLDLLLPNSLIISITSFTSVSLRNSDDCSDLGKNFRKFSEPMWCLGMSSFKVAARLQK